MLECHALESGYGPITVLRDLNLEVDAGTVLAILGPNGAGKTTLLSALSGMLPRSQGEIRVDGQSLPNGRPAAANRAGVVLVPDDRALFTTLTVDENIEAARHKGSARREDMLELFPALASRRTLTAGALSGGEQQMLTMARALVQRPRVLLIDEMSMGLAPIVVETLLPIVRRIADETNAVVVLVEQHVQLALEVADRGMVLVHGSVALEGSASELAADVSRLETAYLGEIDNQ